MCDEIKFTWLIDYAPELVKDCTIPNEKLRIVIAEAGHSSLLAKLRTFAEASGIDFESVGNWSVCLGWRTHGGVPGPIFVGDNLIAF